MTRSTRWLAGLLLASGSVVTVAAGYQGAAALSTAPPAVVRVDLLVDRVWRVEGPSGAPAGALYVFLSDNVMVISAEGRPPTVGTWAEDLAGLVITEKGTTSKVDVLELSAARLRLRINAKAAVELTLVSAVRLPGSSSPMTDGSAAGAAPPATAAATAAAVMPVGSPYRCGADALRVAFEGGSAYITWPDGTSVVLRELKTADATPSRRTFSDGQLRVVEDTSETYTRVLFARAGFRPRPCAPTR